MTDTPGPVVLTGRSSLPATRGAADLDVEWRRSKAIAEAGDMLPKAYRNKPGAVLLLSGWANSRGIDLMTAMQNVGIIEGKFVVDASLQRALAERAGYRVVITDVSTTAATAAVYEGPTLRGSSTYTIEHAKIARLTDRDMWKKFPREMLTARATTQALRWYAPSVLLGVYTSDELDDSESFSVESPALAADPEPLAVANTEAPAEVIHDAEVIEEAVIVEPDEPQARKITQSDLIAAARKAGVKLPDLMAEAQRRSGDNAVTLAALTADQAAASDLLAWIETGEG